jgi:hypothetical protein
VQTHERLGRSQRLAHRQTACARAPRQCRSWATATVAPPSPTSNSSARTALAPAALPRTFDGPLTPCIVAWAAAARAQRCRT